MRYRKSARSDPSLHQMQPNCARVRRPVPLARFTDRCSDGGGRQLRAQLVQLLLECVDLCLLHFDRGNRHAQVAVEVDLIAAHRDAGLDVFDDEAELFGPLRQLLVMILRERQLHDLIVVRAQRLRIEVLHVLLIARP